MKNTLSHYSCALALLLVATASMSAQDAVMDTSERLSKSIQTYRFASKQPRAAVVERVGDLLARNLGWVEYANPELGTISGVAWFNEVGARWRSYLHVHADGDTIHVITYATDGTHYPERLDFDWKTSPLKGVVDGIRVFAATVPK